MLLLPGALLVLIGWAHADEDQCEDYVTRVKPLLESGDIGRLREVFRTMNGDQLNVVTPYAMYAVEASVLVDTPLMKQLLSLSKPIAGKMAAVDAWPENTNAPLPFGKVCEKDATGELVCSDAAGEFHALYSPVTSRHAGVRYVYNCRTLQVRSCFKDTCTYRPDAAVMRDVFVPLDNFIAADGSAVADHVTEGEDAYVIKGFSKMAVRECFARQLFYAPGAEGEGAGCFNTSHYFSLPEVVGMGVGNYGAAPWHDYMVARSDFFVLLG